MHILQLWFAFVILQTMTINSYSLKLFQSFSVLGFNLLVTLNPLSQWVDSRLFYFLLIFTVSFLHLIILTTNVFTFLFAWGRPSVLSPRFYAKLILFFVWKCIWVGSCPFLNLILMLKWKERSSEKGNRDMWKYFIFFYFLYFPSEMNWKMSKCGNTFSLVEDSNIL